VADKGSSSAGGVIGVVLLLAVLVWATGVMVSPHWNMAHDEVLRYRDVINQVNDELSLHRIAAGTILVPRYDDSLDVFVSRSAYQSVPYPDRDELAGAIQIYGALKSRPCCFLSFISEMSKLARRYRRTVAFSSPVPISLEPTAGPFTTTTSTQMRHLRLN